MVTGGLVKIFQKQRTVKYSENTMSLLSHDELLTLVAGGVMSAPTDHINPASVEVTLGHRFYVEKPTPWVIDADTRPKVRADEVLPSGRSAGRKKLCGGRPIQQSNRCAIQQGDSMRRIFFALVALPAIMTTAGLLLCWRCFSEAVRRLDLVIDDVFERWM